MKKLFLLLSFLSSISFSQVPFQYGWPRQGSDDFGLYNSSPTIADFDGDGSLDVSVTECIVSFPNTPRLNGWKSNGAFVPGFPFYAPFGSLQSSGSNEISAAGDVMGDSKLELVYGDENGNIYIINSNGQNVTGSPFNAGATKESTTPALVDLDNDGKCEIIITNYERDSPGGDAKLHVLKYNGTEFTNMPGFPIDFGLGSESSPVVGDLDNNGSYDIVFVSNGGSGVDSKIHAVNMSGTPLPGFPIIIAPSSLGSTPTLYDLNKNGKLEIILRAKPSNTEINGIYAWDYQGNLLPNFPFPIDYGHPDANVAIADMNGDGFPELAFGNVNPVDSGKVYVWDLQGNILPGFPQKIWATWVDGSVALGDVSGDGLPDVIVPTSKGRLYAFKYDGSTIDGYPLIAENVYVVTGFETSPTMVDIDNDGDMEIFATSLNKRCYGYDTPGLVNNNVWSTFKGNAARTGGMLKGFTPVPVELTSFNAVVSNGEVSLRWSTSTETNNKGFQVERFSTSWEIAGFVNGAGTSATENRYFFNDKLSYPGVYQYRLKQIDLNGEFKYYTLKEEVNYNTDISFELHQNYPNPFNPVTMISFRLPEKSFVTIKIYDLLGKEITTLINSEQENGLHHASFDGSNLTSGTYIYKITAGSFSQIKKMTLLK